MENQKDLQKNISKNENSDQSLVISQLKTNTFKPSAEIKTRRTLLILVVVTIILAGGLFFWFSLINKSADELVSKRNIYQQELVNSESLTDIQNKLVLAKNAEEFFKNIYVDADNALNFVTFLEQLSIEAGVDLNIQSLNSSIENNNSESNPYEKIEMTLNFNGGWDPVNNFLLMIENLPHHVIVGDMQINLIPNSAASTTLAWSASMNLEVVAK
jgi:Tfp pilus assembly protein PilO